MAEDNKRSRIALVTGASAGIGKAIVRKLLSEGWRVYGAARRLEKMSDIQAEGARTLSLDVTEDESMKKAVQALISSEGRIDALVNNAGYGSYGAVEDVPISEARRQFEVNVFGLARLAQLVLPTMREQRSGTIVNISSVGGRIWTPVGGWYHATKHAVEVLSDAMRVETRLFGIRVVVVQPGSIKSEWAEIAADHLMEHSQGSAYRAIVETMVKILRHPPSYTASPDVVANVVSKAVNSRNPRRRYATPFHAKVFLFLRWLLPEWIWERVIMSVVR